MSGTLQLGGTNLAVHSGSGASAKITLDSGLVFPAGNIVNTTIYTYAPNALKNLYSGNSYDLYYNPDLDTSVTLTSGNRLIVSICGGRVSIGTAGTDNFVFYVQIAGVDYQVGGTQANPIPLNVTVGSDVINSTSATIKVGGFSRYANRTPTIDLRNSTSGDSSGNGTNGTPLRYIIQEVQV